MDPGSKVFIFFLGGSVVFAGGWWLFRKVFGTITPDPTAPKAKDTWDSPGDYTEPRNHL